MFAYKCGRYCACEVELKHKYNPAIHKDLDFGEYAKQVSDEYVVKISYDCQMGFGELLKNLKMNWERTT